MREHRGIVKKRRSKKALGLRFLRFAFIAYIALAFLGFLKNQGLELLPSVQNLQLLYKLLCLGYLLELMRCYFNSIYILGRHHMLEIAGFLSFRYQKRTVAYGDIRETSIRQSILARVLNFGTLEFGTAASDDFEVTFTDIDDPCSLAQYAQEIISQARTLDSPDGLHAPND